MESPQHPQDRLVFDPTSVAGLEDALSKLSALITEATSFGTRVLGWCAEASKGKPEDLPIMMLFRHLLSLTDAVALLVRSSVIGPCDLLLRGAFEAELSLLWILEEDTERRGTAFLYFHHRSQLTSLEKMDGNTSMGKDFRKAIKADRLASQMELPEVPGLQDRIDRLRGHIQSQFREVDEEYKRLKKARKRKVEWFSLSGGPMSIEQLANRLELSGTYALLYRLWSRSTHAQDVISGSLLLEGSDVGRILPIRFPESAEDPTRHSVRFLLDILPQIIKHFVPERITDFRLWYMSKVRQPFLEISSRKVINIKTSNLDPSSGA